MDYQRLLDSSLYKEQYRKAMIEWGEERRDQDPGYFCSLACQQAVVTPIWLVSDARRPTDIEYFQSRYHCVTVTVWASECVREGRGWTFVPGVDDAPSECALDSYQSDFTINNDGKDLQLVDQLQLLTQLLRSSTSV